ncbi:hypothetical protein GCM10010478_26280 [Streptomyces erythrogriseus]|uniref:AMP-binding enzyme C-terminal domain-containing protein n=1 Tax=Streptomyces erythrogriseus TaxID=284027 RepID=A0ABN3WT54_9ACTN
MTDGGQDEDPAALRGLAPRRHLPSTAIACRRSRTGSARAAARWARVLFTLGATVGHHRIRPAGLCGQQGPKVVVTGYADLTGIELPEDAAQGVLARHPVAAKEWVVGQADGGQFLRRRTSAPLRRHGDRAWPDGVIAQTTRASSEESRYRTPQAPLGSVTDSNWATKQRTCSLAAPLPRASIQGA